MEFFRIKKDIPFMRHAPAFNVISLITFALAVLFLLTAVRIQSVEFTGGTLMKSTTRRPPTRTDPPGTRQRRLS